MSFALQPVYAPARIALKHNLWVVCTTQRERNTRTLCEEVVTYKRHTAPLDIEPMSHTMNETDRAEIEHVVAQLEAAWNAGDGEAFAAPFAEDADFVNVRAEHFSGSAAVAQGHVHIFNSIYKGSRNHYSVRHARLLAADIALVHVDATLEIPAGPMAGTIRALFSAILERAGATWRVVSFHNTPVPASR